MIKKYPKVTILLATFNRAHLILETLDSIKNQTYSNFECLIIDDNSIDTTAQVVQDFIKEDFRFKYYKKPSKYSQGLSSTRNFGLDLIQNSKSEYVLFADDDDILHPNNLEICIKNLESSDFDFLHYRLQPFINNPGSFKDVNSSSSCDIITEKNLIDVLNNKIALASCSVMWKKKSIQQERFLEGLYYAEELEFYSRLLIMGKKGCMIPTTLYYNRKHANSNTGAFFKGDPKYTQSLIKAYYFCIDNLVSFNKLNYQIAKFFVWRAVLKKEEALFDYILENTQFNLVSKIKLKLLFNFSGLVSFYLKKKKVFGQNISNYRFN